MKWSFLIILLIDLARGSKKRKRHSSSSSEDRVSPHEFWRRIKRTRSDRFDLGDGLNFQLNEAAWYDNLPIHGAGDMNPFFSDSSSSGSSFEHLRRKEQRQRKRMKKFKKKTKADDKISWRDEAKINKLKGKKLYKRSYSHKRKHRRHRKKKSTGYSSIELAFSDERDINKNLRFVSDWENLDLRYVNPFCSYAIPSYEEDLRRRKRHQRLVEQAKRRRERVDPLHEHRWHHRDHSNVLYDYVKDEEVIDDPEHDREVRDLRHRLLEERKARKRAEEKVKRSHPTNKEEKPEVEEIKAMVVKQAKGKASPLRLGWLSLLPLFFIN